jgi:hypothetical protein
LWVLKTALFVWLISHQPTVLFSQNKSATSNQPIQYILSQNNILFGWLVADGWCWFVLREEYCWLVAAGCWWLIRSERKVLLTGG